jgi:hypothetical protein
MRSNRCLRYLAGLVAVGCGSTSGGQSGTGGAIAGRALLAGESEHGQITVQAAGRTTLTSSDGSFRLDGIPSGPHVVDFVYRDGCLTGSVSGRAAFADGRLDRGGVQVSLQYSSRCFRSSQLLTEVVAGQLTQLEDVTLEAGG